MSLFHNILLCIHFYEIDERNMEHIKSQNGKQQFAFEGYMYIADRKI